MKVKQIRSCDVHTAAHQRMTPLKVNTVRGIVWPNHRRVAAPPLQDKMGGDKRVSHFFDHKFWTVHQEKGAMMKCLTLEEWERLGKMWHQEELQSRPRNETQVTRRFNHKPFTSLNKMTGTK